ncbi:monocarboxylate transporter 12-like isoform X1 [Haliotis rufescens]|uniref:monocarboxylate transporter 12-like isoform X1 n=1 Tax=Haliotis rufescens TaxID=6454 RepID=UPI00201F5F90|nr:monocarboxylate transporter 12-like isoform X1 [Haliotis rufescens]
MVLVRNNNHVSIADATEEMKIGTVADGVFQYPSDVFPVRRYRGQNEDTSVPSSSTHNHGQVTRNSEILSQPQKSPLTYSDATCLLSGFFVFTIASGMVNTYGVLYTYMLPAMDVSEYQLSWLGAVMSGVNGLSAILAAVLTDNFGCGVTASVGAILLSSGILSSSQTTNIYALYMLLGAMPGLGYSLLYICLLVQVNQHFTTRRPLAVGLVASGTGVGRLCCPLLVAALAEEYGWQGALLILGGVCLNLLACCLLMQTKRGKATGELNTTHVLRAETSAAGDETVHMSTLTQSRGQVDQEARPQSQSKQADQTKDRPPNPLSASLKSGLTKLRDIFRVRGAVIFGISQLICGLGYHSYPTFLPAYIMASLPAVTSTQGAQAVSLIGFGNVIGRLGFASLSMLGPRVPIYLFILGLIVCGFTNILVTLCQSTHCFLVTSVVYGVAVGGSMGLFSIVLVDMFGLENISKTLGIFLFCNGIGLLCGPPIESSLVALTGVREDFFYSSGTFYLLSALAIVLIITGKIGTQLRRRTYNINVKSVSNPAFTTANVDA